MRGMVPPDVNILLFMQLLLQLPGRCFEITEQKVPLPGKPGRIFLPLPERDDLGGTC